MYRSSASAVSRSGRDAFEYLLAGASAIQVGTVFEKEGPGCFTRIQTELQEILDAQGSTIEEARGSLRPLDPTGHESLG
jgi:dihydroorotate dehydrogenase (fumarate)